MVNGLALNSFLRLEFHKNVQGTELKGGTQYLAMGQSDMGQRVTHRRGLVCRELSVLIHVKLYSLHYVYSTSILNDLSTKLK